MDLLLLNTVFSLYCESIFTSICSRASSKQGKCTIRAKRPCGQSRNYDGTCPRRYYKCNPTKGICQVWTGLYRYGNNVPSQKIAVTKKSYSYGGIFSTVPVGSQWTGLVTESFRWVICDPV